MALDPEHKLNLAIAAVATTAVTLLAVGAASAKPLPESTLLKSAALAEASLSQSGRFD